MCVTFFQTVCHVYGHLENLDADLKGLIHFAIKTSKTNLPFLMLVYDLKAAQERSKEGRHAALAMGQRPQRPCTFPRLAAPSATTAKAAHSSWSALVRARLGSRRRTALGI